MLYCYFFENNGWYIVYNITVVTCFSIVTKFYKTGLSFLFIHFELAIETKMTIPCDVAGLGIRVLCAWQLATVRCVWSLHVMNYMACSVKWNI